MKPITQDDPIQDPDALLGDESAGGTLAAGIALLIALVACLGAVTGILLRHTLFHA